MITSLWYANALTVVILLYHPLSYRAWLVAGYIVGLGAGYWFSHVAATTQLILLLANLTEIFVAVRLLEYCPSARNFYLNIQSALKLGIYGVLLPSLAGTLPAVAGFALSTPWHWSELAIAWYVNAVIGGTSVMPLLLLIKHRRWTKNRYWSLSFQLLLLLGYTAVILKYFPFPYVYLSMGLALIVIRQGIFGAALAGALVSFCIAVFIRMAWFSWPQYDKHLLMLYVYLPILITLIPPLLLAVFVDVLHLREQQLLARESMLREAMEASAVGMALVSTDGQFLKVNPALCLMLDYSEAELTELSWPQLVHPDDLASVQHYQQRLLNNQQSSYRLEIRYRRKNEQMLWVLLVVSMVRDNRGLPHYFVMQAEDIDSRRSSEERERDLFNRYLLAAEASQVGVWEWRPTENQLSWDERMFDLYALDRRHIVPSFSIWKSCIHPDDLFRLMREISQALNETNVLDSEFRVIHHDDSIHYLRMHAMVERDDAGKVIRMVGTNWDITEVRVLMNDLARERELLRTTLLSIGEAVVMTDQKARIVFINPAAEQMLGCSNHNVTHLAVDRIMQMVNAEGEQLENPLHAALRRRCLIHLDNDVYLKRSDSAIIAVQDSASPILRNNKELLGGVLVLSDITEMRALQKRLGYQASHDPLTGLINRSAFETILQDVQKESVMTAGQSVLVYLDLDYFKLVNDSAGHAAGDALLKQLATLMSSRMRASDIVARLGGDEFGLILRNCSLEYAESFMRGLIIDICHHEFLWHGQIFHIGASAGLVSVHGQFPAFTSLLASADQACYAAKRAGRGQVKIVGTSF
ncbi:MAG: PAS domain S-box protein [Tolumonas sp.]